MRIRTQLPLFCKTQSEEIDRIKELKNVTNVLRSLPTYKEILERVEADLLRESKINLGRSGMTAEQVLICIVVKQLQKASYRMLSTLTVDSITVRKLMVLGDFDKGFKASTIQKNIKKITEETLDFIFDAIISQKNKIDDGTQVRTDGTTVETNIHHPSDWTQMHDSIRVLSRIMTRVYEKLNIEIQFQNHYKASKSKLFRINNSRKQNEKHALCVEHLRLLKKTLKDAKKNELLISQTTYGAEFSSHIKLAEQVYNIAYRRIIKGEQVPAKEKLVSIFEDHTDIIAKGKREVEFGHKITITTGKTGLIFDLQIHDGNPADSTLVQGVYNNLTQKCKIAPKVMAFDGCYNSNNNVEFLKEKGVQYSFSKGPNSQSSNDKKVNKKLYNFRAGIEACISLLKRKFGLTRIFEKTKIGFHKAVKKAVIVYNLCVLAKFKKA